MERMGQATSNTSYLQTCSHLGICDPNLNTVRIDFAPMREETPGISTISSGHDAQLIPTSRVMRKGLASKQKDGYVDRGMLAKAEWERQLRAKIEQREKDRSEQMLEIASSIEASAKPPEQPSMNDERQKALDAIQQDLFGGRICDRSHIPVLKEEDETSTEDEPRPGSSGTSALPGSKEVSQPQQPAVSMSQYSTQATAETGDSGSDDALVSTFLEKHGLRDVNAKKRRFLRSTYPLHLAVQEGNPRLVVAILARGAKKEQKNSLGMTAEEVAKKSNKDGSHRQVLEALGVVQQLQ